MEKYVKGIHYDLDIEQSLIGSLVKEPSGILEIDLEPESFYAPAHRKIFKRIKDVYTDKAQFSLSDLSDIIINIEDTTVIEYVQDCAYGALTVNNQGYSDLLTEMEEKRKLHDLCNDIIESAPTKDSNETKKLIHDFLESNITKTGVMTEQQVYESILDSFERPAKHYTTGIPRLDKIMGGGFYEGYTYGLAGKEKAGKTAMAGTISYNLSEAGVKHLYVAMEMGASQIQQRNYARMAGVNPLHFLTPSDSLVRKMVKIKPKNNVFYLDAPSMTLSEVLSEVAKCQIKHGIKGFIIDYLQIIQSTDFKRTEEAQHRETAQRIANFCRKRGLFSLVLAQQNDNGKLFQGGGLRKACDMLFFLEIKDKQDSERQLRMDATRYTPVKHLGVNDEGLNLVKNVGVYFEDAADAS